MAIQSCLTLHHCCCLITQILKLLFKTPAYSFLVICIIFSCAIPPYSQNNNKKIINNFLVTAASSEHIRELEVSEGVAIGYQIGFIGEFLHGVDSGPPYLIVPVPGSAVDSDLTIDHTTGEIRTKVLLDRETRSSYSLVAIPLSGENVRVIVRVLDENDNAPTFPQPVMQIEFPENTPRDVKRTLNPARDLDLGRFNTQRYNIISGNVNNAFRLSSHRERDGVLYLDLQINGFLDRETTPDYSLVIEALDGGSPPLRGQMTVNITILDVNDNQPIFNQSRYFGTIPENATVGTSVLQVYAYDADSGENGLISYSINRRQSDKDQMFRIDLESGLITVNKPLDFETKELHELVVVATDHGDQPLETTAFVSIRVTDVNDNQPTINVIFLSDDATPKISESAQPGEFVARISVNDPDSKTEYANVNVSLSGGDGHFGLTTRDNIIYLVIVSLPLDREVQPNYILNVVATDQGNPPLHATKTIHLKVIDINDNAPEFEKDVYYANVMEIADPGTSVLQVIAIDRDEGNNSAIIYSLLDTPDTHSQWFRIDEHTGLITTRAHIDCETEPVPQLTVMAADSGYPPLSSTATVFVTIHDVNDNEPIFDQSFYNVSVAENELRGRCILKVSASDPDCGVNAMVNYTLGDGFKKLTEFEVKYGTGEVCIQNDLDYEKRSSYEFPIIATDRGGLSTTAMIKIQVTDINDNRPIFYPREYNVSMRETPTISSASPVIAVVATDLDSGRFGAVSYRIVAGNEAGIFRIDRLSGEIFISRPNMLSSRTQPMHKLNVSASDGGGLRTLQDAEVYISIIDATHRPPIFEKSRYNYYVKEDVHRGTVVGSVLATSSDSGSRGAVRYSIYSGDPDGYFSIDSISGNIRIANSLDHETKQQVLLNVQATSGDPPAYGHTQVNIDIEDVNDNPPEFESNTVRISVPENVELGTPLYAANALDKDSGKCGIVTYRLHNSGGLQAQITTNGNRSKNIISSGGTNNINNNRNSIDGGGSLISSSSASSTTNLFAIDARSGHLTLLRHLDYETSQRHSLIVTATDSGEPPLSANLTILVEVQDINDNPPVFERNEYTIKVIESMPVNSQIIQVTAVDLDTGNNARLTYRIIASQPIHQQQYNKHLNKSLLNATTITKTLTTKATATATTPSSSSSSSSSTLTMIKTITTASVATDSTQYSDDLSELFGIFPNSGWIYLRGMLDRETNDRYDITVRASDNGTPSASATTHVIVNVLDANDNDPKFSRDSYQFSIEENLRRGAVIGSITATDDDIDANAAIRYSLIPSNTSFQVNPVTGEIVTREPLDRELRATYDLVAEARDEGTPYRSARVPVRVLVSDVNDNAPDIVDPQEDVVSVREEQLPGTEVVKVRAIDRDSGLNATIQYSILKGRDSDGYGLFTIDPETGIIRTRVVLDHEERSIYRLAVAATDGGKPPKQTVRLLRVEVLDLNDNRPTFTSSSLLFKVKEDVPVGYIVGSINGRDHNDATNLISNNDGLHVTYTLTSLTTDTIDGAFDMDRNTGSLVVARSLDREQQNEYRLEIRALDTTASNNPQSSAVTVKVEIIDVNDNAPVWSEDPIIINIIENTPIGTGIYNFTAFDKDTGNNGGIHYTLLKQMPLSIITQKMSFSVDPLTGQLTLIDSIDYEQLTEYLLIVCATDQSQNVSERLSTSVTVRILIIDANDNVPIFVSPDNGGGNLDLDNNNNNGNNNNEPIIIYVSDSTAVGQRVTHVVAIDNDSGENGRISYRLLNGNEEEFFKIDQNNGYIELAKPLMTLNDPHHQHHHQILHSTSSLTINPRSRNGILTNGKFLLTIGASDNGLPVANETKMTLQIVIKGSSTNPPRFLESVYHANISESIATGSFVVRVNAKSIHGDNGGGNGGLGGGSGSMTNGNLTYEIPSGVADDHFTVDRLHGIVTTKGQFDRETKDFYMIPIYVTDSSTNIVIPSATTTSITTTTSATSTTPIGNINSQFDVATIMVKITDINDHAPEFRPGSCYPLAVPENSEFSVIHTVVATDLDEGVNGQITYSITGGNFGNKFNIDMHTGELTARPLDRETHSRFFLQITAQDHGTPISYQGTCNITVTVEDQNDNDPRFELSKYVSTIAEDVTIGTSVLTVKATDADLGINARIVYSLANETQWLFSIDNRSGLISTVGPLDREKQQIYNFMVVATDGGRSDSRSQRVPVQIIIEDINDNKPQFVKYPFKGQVPALVQPGQMLLQVKAFDIDQGTNGEILYSLMNDSSNGKFRLNPNTGALSATQSLASENGKLLYLEIMARDKGNPPQSTTGLIELRIGDIPPGTPDLRFQNETYTVKLLENTGPGFSVVQLKAVRSDGRRQKIIYSIGMGNEDGTFSIDSITGEIKVKNSGRLDYEQYNQESGGIKLIGVARTEGGTPPQIFGYCEIRILLEDENDNAPRFTQQQYSATVWEGNHKGTLVMKVSALDADQGANSRVLYHIVDGNHDNAFIIEPAFSGIVKTNIVLDREIRDSYRLKVISTDEGVPQMTGTATIHVHIIDINDNQPTFPPHSIITISEGTELGSVLTVVSANDVDTYPSLIYSFADVENLDETQSFSIDRFSGKIVLKKRLDYETKQEYQLKIAASDSAHVAYTTLIIRVTDINDNAPIFQQPAYHVTLPDKISNNDLEILTVNATDLDKDKNADIHYSLVKQIPGFTIGERSGILYANTSRIVKPLANSYMQLSILASDLGTPSLNSVATVRILLNLNGYAKPHFLQNQYRTTINESATKGTTILKISPELIDSIEHQQNIIYEIVSGNDDNVFEVIQSTSAIILIKSLDREQIDSYNLRLICSELGVVSSKSDNSSGVNIFITVEDANDNAPIFEKNIYETTISEATPLKYSIAKLIATDEDLPNSPNSEVVYDITSGNVDGMFSIDLVTGILSVNNDLDYDRGMSEYSLVIRACDSAIIPKCSLCQFFVSLTDENDNDPRFPVTEYLEFVGENEPIGVSVFTARATDLDKGKYGQLNYSISSSAEYSDADESWKMFKVDELTGIVTTNSVFDYEMRNRYTFTLKASDIGNKIAMVKVRVIIESRDEFSPQFTERTYRFVLATPSYGALPLGYVVGQVTATDRDKGPDGRVVYQLTTQHPYFKINRTTGAVIIKKKLDNAAVLLQESQRRDISLVVTASSGRQGSLTNMTVVEIVFDPLADPGTNQASTGIGSVGNNNNGSNNSGGLTDWALGLLISVLLVILSFAAVFLFLHMKNRRHKQVIKPRLSTETVGNSNSYVDPTAFDTIPIRGNSNSVTSVTGQQFAPPKYDEIPPYGTHTASTNSNGGGAGGGTTSELSGSEQSGSSGRGSAEDGDDGEDEEIRMINEGPLPHRSNNGDAGTNHDGRLSDMSVHNTQEYLARLGIVDNPKTQGAASTSSRRCSESIGINSTKDNMHHHHPLPIDMFDEEPGGDGDITNLIYAKLNDVNGSGGSSTGGGGGGGGGPGSERASSTDDAGTTVGSVTGPATVDHVMGVMGGFGDHPVVGSGGTNPGPSMNGSLSSIVHSEEELTGSYNWDYLLDWGPQYQPLAHVFSEIARLKDDTMSVHSGNSGASSAKSKGSLHPIKHIPPPLLTNVAPRAIPILSARGNISHHPAGGSINQYLLPRSPINHDQPGNFSAASAMSPSFSPSLSPLANQSPSISPHIPAPNLSNLTNHNMVSLPRQQQQQHQQQLQQQQQPQPQQRKLPPR